MDDILTPSELLEIIEKRAECSIQMDTKGRIDKLCQFGINPEILNDKSRSLFISQLKSYLNKYNKDTQERRKIEDMIAIGLTPLQAYNIISLPAKTEEDIQLICNINPTTILSIINN